jgi:hypothetical protein
VPMGTSVRREKTQESGRIVPTRGNLAFYDAGSANSAHQKPS